MVALLFTPALAAVNEIVWRKFSAWTVLELPVAVDENGNVITVRSPLIDSPIITKMSGGGRVLWTRQVGVTGSESGVKDVAIDSDGYIYVVGFTFGLEPRPKAFISKYGPRGGHHWTKRIEKAYIEKVDVGPGGNIYVVGTAFGELPNMPPGSDWPDPFIRKYNPDGKIYWTRLISLSDFTDRAEVYDVAVGPGGGIYVVGYDYSAYSGNKLRPNGGLFLRKYSPRGGIYWTESVRRNEPYLAFDADVVVDRRGEVTIVAEAYSDSRNGTEAVAIKYTHKGKRMWTRLSPGLFPTSLAVDSDRNIYVVGRRVRGGKVFSRKYQANGNHMWTRDIANDGYYSSVAADAANNLYVAGTAGRGDSAQSFLVKFRR